MIINNEMIVSLDTNMSEGTYFSHKGCANCGNGLGNDVEECQAWTENDGVWDYYEVDLCNTCLCAYHNGTELDNECNNHFNI